MQRGDGTGASVDLSKALLAFETPDEAGVQTSVGSIDGEVVVELARDALLSETGTAATLFRHMVELLLDPSVQQEPAADGSAS